MKLHRGKRTDTDTKHSVLHIQAGQASDYGQQALRIYGVQECYGVLVRTERALMPDKRRLRSCLVWGPESSSCTLCFLQGHECTEYGVQIISSCKCMQLPFHSLCIYLPGTYFATHTAYTLPPGTGIRLVRLGLPGTDHRKHSHGCHPLFFP